MDEHRHGPFTTHGPVSDDTWGCGGGGGGGGGGDGGGDGDGGGGDGAGEGGADGPADGGGGEGASTCTVAWSVWPVFVQKLTSSFENSPIPRCTASAYSADVRTVYVYVLSSEDSGGCKVTFCTASGKSSAVSISDADGASTLPLPLPLAFPSQVN